MTSSKRTGTEHREIGSSSLPGDDSILFHFFAIFTDVVGFAGMTVENRATDNVRNTRFLDFEPLACRCLLSQILYILCRQFILIVISSRIRTAFQGQPRGAGL